MEKYMEASELVVPGYYWWLPEYLRNEPELEANWSIVAWHPKNSERANSGQFVGPLAAPVKAKA